MSSLPPIHGFCRDSVGAIIKNKKGDFLVLYRAQKPTGLALPATHINKMIEDPGDALRRAVLQKTGIRIINIKFRGGLIVEAACRYGFTTHYWHVYDVLSWDGEPELKQPNEHRFVKFMSAKEMNDYIERGEMLVAWSKFLLKDLGVL